VIPWEELAELDGFGDLDGRTLRAVGALFSRRSVADGTVLLEQDTRTGGAVLVLSGSVVAVRRDPCGGLVVVDRCGPGSLCGAEEVIEGVPRQVSLVAEGRSTVGLISSSDFSELMDGRSRVALRFQLTVARTLFAALRRGNARLASRA
jgi:CRP-like cAMP-binding protein